MANPFDQFDQKETASNPFDQFDGPPVARAESVAMGVTDPAFGLTQFLTRYLPQSLIDGLSQSMDETQGTGRAIPVKEAGTVTPEKFDQQLQGLEADYQRRRGPDAGVDWWRIGGNVAATAPMAAVMPASAPSVLGTTARGAATGGALAATQPVYGGDYETEKAKQVGLGMATGGVFSGGTQAVGKAVAPRVSKSVQYLRERGVTPRPGQIAGKTAANLEDAFGSINPAVGVGQRRAIEQFNRAAYNEVLSSLKSSDNPVLRGIRTTVPKNFGVGRRPLEWVGNQISKAYNKLLPTLRFVPDEKFSTEVAQLRSMIKELPPKEASRFDRLWKAVVSPRLDKPGFMDGRSFKGLESQLKSAIRKARKSTDIDQQDYADALDELLGSFQDALVRSNPENAPTLRAIDAAWSKLIPIEEAAGSASKGGVFTPFQLLNGIKKNSATVRKRGFARGRSGELQKLGEAGQDVLGNTYPDSGTAMRSLMGLGVLGGASMVSPPAAIGLGTSMLGYTPTGQRALAALLASRPAGAAPVRRLLERSAVPAGGLLGLGAAGSN